MNAAMIAAQEQRLARIAFLESIPKSQRRLDEIGLLVTLAKIVRRDAALHGGEFRRTRP